MGREPAGTTPLHDVEVRPFSSPSPKRPVLVCGLPGSGYVGKLAADYVVSVFKAKKVAEFHSTAFPPNVNVNEEGLALRLKGELYHAETGQARDLLVFTADAQPGTSEGEYELADVVLREAKRLGSEMVFTLAAYVTGTFVRERSVHGTATSPDVLPMLSASGVSIMHEGGISGMNGIMVGMAKLHGMEGISLLGETAGYLLDPAASHAVLERLSEILEIKIDLALIEERAKEAQQVFGQVQRLTEQSVEEVRGSREEGTPGYIA
ncbi:MAG TPA: PAC2 family protein [Nitrososphaerales archaeon]|nr:PAC2 family protein [Nitrososphaerales archaeon]